MEEKYHSEGKCLYCGQTFLQQGISRHMATHLSAMEKQTKSSVEGVWHIKVEANEMFLQLLVSANAKFKKLDTFLRNIWVECCGHLSGFAHRDFKVPMSRTFDEICSPRLKIEYQYDYGSTTYLDVVVMKRYNIEIQEDILLLSRNEPLQIMCGMCNKKPAVSICSVCIWDSHAFYCESCIPKHEAVCEDFADYANMPVVNSPRMGTCGYEGGVIDTERDGVYVMKK